MRRSFVLLGALSLLLALPAAAQNSCNLGLSMTCDSSNVCSATVANNGTTACSGDYVVAIAVISSGGATVANNAKVTNFHQTLGLAECFDNSLLPVTFGVGVCTGVTSLAAGASFSMSADVALNGTPATDILGMTLVEDPASSTEIGFAYQFNTGAGSAPTCTPLASVAGTAQTGNQYTVSWTPVSDPSATFTIDESTSPDFTANLITTTPVSGQSKTFTHSVTAATTYYYRVRANSCGGATPGPNSPTVAVVVTPVPTVTGRQGDVTVPLGSTSTVSLNVFVPGLSQPASFTATVDKPYWVVQPSSGTLPTSGLNLSVIANPANLPPGASTGTLTITVSSGSGKGGPAANDTTTVTKSVSVSLVTPVAPGGKTLPPENSLIIPVVAHAPGALGPFQSDVRLLNANTSAVNYQLTYTPTQIDGTTSGKTTTLTVDAGQSIALNDILNDFFGVGAAGDSGYGSLELRPLNSSTTLNYASSRTYTFNPNGTYGQFITAIPFVNFATRFVVPNPLNPTPPTPPTPILSLQQISDAGSGAATGSRTQIGLEEGSGTPANGHIALFDDSHNQIATAPYTLLPGEHVQKSLAAWFGMQTLPISDGRIEVTSEGTTGAVTAYASVLDNITNDPVAIAPVQASQISSTRFILPGMAALGTTGPNNFHSDIRLYNGGASSVTLNATYYPQGGGTPVNGKAPITIPAGNVVMYNDVIAGPLFNAPGNGGSVVFTTATQASVVATGRTYTIASNNGTFGQGIPGVTPSQGIGMGDRPMQLLQLEESPLYRTNVAAFELTGNQPTVTNCGGPLTNPVTVCVQISGYSPDSKVAANVYVPLGPNQFTQLGHILAGMFPGETIYNARASVQVVGGTGRVAAYGSVIDNGTTAGAYVPSQQ